MQKCLEEQKTKMDRTYRILHVIPAYGGGISSYVKNLIAAPNNDNIIMDVTGFGKMPENFGYVVTYNNGKIYELPNAHKNFGRFIQAYCDILNNNYDAVHCHISGYKGWIFKVIAHVAGVKLIITHAHRTDDEKKGLFYKIKLAISQKLSQSCSDCYMTCSMMAADFIFGKRFVKQHSIWMMPNTIDPMQYKGELTDLEKKTYLEELGLKSKPEVIIGHIGRFNKQKNHQFLIKIAKKLKEDELDFSMILIGDGADLEKIKECVKVEGLQNEVIFLGKRDDVNRLLKFMDVMVLPSLFEGLPTVAVEAQAAGTPCLLADTITEEADLGMDLVQYLPITEGDELWCEAIKKCLTARVIGYSERVEQLKKKGFIDSEMRMKYAENLCAHESGKYSHSNIHF